MFTGLIADLGVVADADAGAEGMRLIIRTTLAPQLSDGDSIAVNGVCLTATGVTADGFTADVMHQTLRSSSLAALLPGGGVNLELALRAADRLGGHVVQGHVDGVGRVASVTQEGFAARVECQCEADILRYLVGRGSVAVDGVSLTVAELGDESFALSLIPETLQRTTLGSLNPGQVVNIEVDVLAKYVERLLGAVHR